MQSRVSRVGVVAPWVQAAHAKSAAALAVILAPLNWELRGFSGGFPVWLALLFLTRVVAM